MSHRTGDICQPYGAEVRHYPESRVRDREPCPLPRSLPWPIGWEAHQLALVRWRVPGDNSDLFLAVVAVYLCHQLKPTCVPQRVRLKVSVERFLADCTARNVSGYSSFEGHTVRVYCVESTARDVSLCGIAQLALFS